MIGIWTIDRLGKHMLLALLGPLRLVEVIIRRWVTCRRLARENLVIKNLSSHEPLVKYH